VHAFQVAPIMESFAHASGKFKLLTTAWWQCHMLTNELATKTENLTVLSTCGDCSSISQENVAIAELAATEYQSCFGCLIQATSMIVDGMDKLTHAKQGSSCRRLRRTMGARLEGHGPLHRPLQR